MRRTWRLLTSLVLCLVALASHSEALAQSATTSVGVKDVVAVLSQGTAEQRYEMMTRVVALRVTAKSPEVRRAVARELARINSLVELRRQNLARGIDAPEATGDYRGLLVQACNLAAEDDVVLDPLLGAIETGNMAQEAIARFGPKAVERVMAISNDDTRPAKVFCALETLSKMLVRRTIDQDEATRIAALARRRMSGENAEAVWLGLVRLAVATGDPELRGKVASIAAGTVLPSVRGSISEAGKERIKRVAQRALGGNPR